MCRSLNDFLVVKISEEMMKHWVWNGILCHMALLGFNSFNPRHQYVYSSYCSLYISKEADKENLCNSQQPARSCRDRNYDSRYNLLWFFWLTISSRPLINKITPWLRITWRIRDLISLALFAFPFSIARASLFSYWLHNYGKERVKITAMQDDSTLFTALQEIWT